MLDARTAALSSFAQLIDSWNNARIADAYGSVAPHARVSSSHQGDGSGAQAVASMWQDTYPSSEILTVTASNQAVTGDHKKAILSAYLVIDLVTDSETRFSAGAFAILDIAYLGSEWQIERVRSQLSWHDGDASARPQWVLPRETGWQAGDPDPVFVSELDAPWHAMPVLDLAGDEETQIAELFYRYAWALDQADFTLLASCYANDAAGDFRPIGQFYGRGAIVGQMKAFRMPWPQMQHYIVPLDIRVCGDLGEMIVGRLVPQRSGSRGVYGAHYRVKLSRRSKRWLIIWSEYVPGWFKSDDADYSVWHREACVRLLDANQDI